VLLESLEYERNMIREINDNPNSGKFTDIAYQQQPINVRNVQQEDDAIVELDWGQIDKHLKTKAFSKNLPKYNIDSLRPNILFSN